MLALIVGAFATIRMQLTEDADIGAAISGVDGEFDPLDSIEVASLESGRPNYRYSVIPGGAYNEVELRTAIQNDPVVAAHYEHLDQSKLRVERVSHDRYVHVSYRKGDKVFWTKDKVLLRQGETILTDGRTQVRARCGNCISEEPLQPTADQEPETVEFDRLTDWGPEPRATNSGETVLLPSVLSPATESPVPGSIAQLLGAPDPLAMGYFGGAEAPLPLASTRGGGGSEPVPNPLPGIDVPTPPGTPGFPGLPPGDLFPNPPGTVPPGLDFVPPPGLNPEVPPTVIDDLLPPGSPGEPVPVPEPGTLFLLGGGVAAMFRMLRSRAS